MSRQLLGGIEIFSQQRRRHHQGRPGIGEPFARRPIHRKFLRRIQRGHAGQVPDGVSVFHVGQAPQHHRSWITCIRQGDPVQRALHPVRQELHLFRTWLRFVLGRHLMIMDLLQGVLPHRRIVLYQVQGLEALKVEIPLLLFRGMAGDTVFLEQRLDGLLEVLLTGLERGTER